MPRRSTVRAVTTIGIDMGKNTLHMVGLDSLGAIVLRERVSRGRITSRLANLLPNWHRSGDGNTLRCSGARGAWPRREAGSAGICEAVSAGDKNDFRDAHAVAEAVQRPTTRFVPAKTNEQPAEVCESE